MFLIIDFTRGRRITFSDGAPSGAWRGEGGDVVEDDALNHTLFGFYDWLQSPEGTPVAMRLTLVGTATSLGAALQGARGVVIETEGVLRIELVSGVPADEYATDQHFGSLRLFSGRSGHALSIDACDITPEQARDMLARQDPRRSSRTE